MTIPSDKKPTKSSVKLEALEPRVMFSADVLPVVVGSSVPFGWNDELSLGIESEITLASGRIGSERSASILNFDENDVLGMVSPNASPVLEDNIETRVQVDGAVPITASQLFVSDTDNDPIEILYTITSSPLHGFVALDTAPWLAYAITSFTQQDIDDEKLVYIHTGGGTVDSFDFTVSDGASDTSGTFNLNIVSPVAIELSSGVELNLDGGNGVYLQSSPLNVSSLNETTVELIFAAQSIADSTPLFSIDDGASQPVSIGVNNLTGELEFSVGGGATEGSSVLNYSTTLLDGNLHSLALTWDAADGGWSIYVDGTRVDSGSGLNAGATLDFTSHNVLVGQYSTVADANSYFSGDYYDIRVWDHARSSEDIGHLHDRKIDTTSTDLVFNSHMDGLAPGSPIIDQVSGNPLAVVDVSDPLFVPSVARSDLNVNENSPAGTHVGYLLAHESALKNFIQIDGDFTDAGTPASTQVYNAGETLGGWQVAGGSVDQFRADGVVSDETLLGGNSLRLTDAGASVDQVLATKPGTLYQLNYSVSGDFSSATTPVSVTATVGNRSDEVTVSMDPAWDLQTKMMWQHRSIIFAADSNTTQLDFSAITGNAMIADVVVVEIPLDVASVLASQRDMTYDAITNKFYKTQEIDTTITGALNTAVDQTVFGVSSRIVTIHSAYENARVHSLIKDYDDRVWLGADDSVVEGDWRWNLGGGETLPFWSGDENGVPVDDAYNNWVPNQEPNEHPHMFGEDYAVMDPSGYWYDEPVDVGLNKVVYEWDAKDVSNAYQYTADSGNSGNGFTVDPESGEVTVDGSVDLNHETVEVIASDLGVKDLDGQVGLRQFDITINDINEPPTGKDKTVTIDEDAFYVFSSTDIGFTDIDGHNLDAIEVTNTPTKGVLELSGVTVVAGDVIDVANIANLRFVPDQNAFGTNYSSFDFIVQDTGGTDNGGVNVATNPNTISIDVTAVNDAPSGTDAAIAVSENTVYNFQSTNFGFSDQDSDDFETVTITSLPMVGDLYHSGAPVLDGQAIGVDALSQLAYIVGPNLSSVASTSFTFRVQDSGGTPNGGEDTDQTDNTITLNILANNLPPTGADKTITINEDTTYAFSSMDFGFTDVDQDDFVAIEVVSAPVNGALTLNGAAVMSGDTVLVSEFLNLRFVPAQNANGVNYDSFTFKVKDNGGSANAGSDTDSVENKITIDVTPVNDAPAGSDASVETREDVPYAFSVSDFGFIDVDGHNLDAIIVVNTPAKGVLELSGVAVMAGDFINVGSIANLRYVPDQNAFGSNYTNFDFIVQDNGGINNDGVNVASDSNTISIDVTAVNDAPAGTDVTLQTNEDTAYVFTAADFGYSDLESNEFASLTVTSLPQSGELTLSGSAASQGQSINVDQLANLEFQPDPEEHGSNYASFGFTVKDNGSTANGGANTDQTANTVVVNVLSVNDAPVGVDVSRVLSEDASYVFSLSDFAFTDTEQDNLESVEIVGLPGNGELTLAGVPVNPLQLIPVASISDLVFTPEQNGFGQSYASFEFKVKDEGGIVNGGADTDPGSAQINFNVLGVNDEPAGTDSAITITETNGYVFSAADFGFTDSDGHELEAVIVSSVPTTGQLTLSGVAVEANQLIEASDLGNLEFHSPFGGGITTGFDFQVRDTGGRGNGGVDTDQSLNKITISILNVNHAPAGANNSLTIVEDASYQFSIVDFGFTDIDQNDFQSVEIVTTPASGLLSLSGSPVVNGQVIAVQDIPNINFSPAPDASGSSYAALSFIVKDDGDTLNGGTNTDQTANVIEFDVLSVNDAPTGNDQTIIITEDERYIFDASVFGFTDVEQNDFSTVTITSIPSKGLLDFDASQVFTGQVIAAERLSDLNYTPVANESGTGYVQFAFQVQDNGGTANGGIDTATTENVITFDVQPVNDAPDGSSNTIVLNEDTSYSFNGSEFPFSDIENNQLLEITVTTLPSDGVLTLSGVPVTPMQSVLAADIQNLVFTPAPDASGVPYTQLQYQIRDSGGVVNGGVDTDPQIDTLTIIVNNINDAPVGQNVSVQMSEDTDYIFTLEDFNYTDSENDALLAVHIDAIPATGLLRLSNVALTDGELVLAADIDAGLLVYTPPANFHGQAELDFRAVDAGGIENNGADTDLSINKIQLVINAVNDVPQGTDNSVVLLEDTAYVFAVDDFGYTDPVDADPMQSVLVENLPVHGSLRLFGVELVTGQSVSAAAIAGGQLTYTPGVNDNNNTGFDFLVVDTNGGIAESTNHFEFKLLSVNDMPLGRDSTVQIDEGAIYALSISDFGFSDPSDNNKMAGITLGELPTTGQLSLNGQSVLSGDQISVDDITSAALVYQADANTVATVDRLGFTVRDDGGVENSGVDTDTTENYLVFDIQEINDAPQLSTGTITLDEASTYTISEAELFATDVDDGPEGLYFTVVEGAQNGSLLYENVVLSTGDSFTLADIINDRVRYLHDGSETATDSVLISLADGGEDGVVPMHGTLSFNIIDIVDLPPELADDNVIASLGDVIEIFVLENDQPGLENTDEFQITIEQMPDYGQVVLNSDGNIEYIPNESGELIDAFSYRVTNSDGAFSVATVNINIVPPVIASAFAAENEVTIVQVPLAESGGDSNEQTVVEHTDTEQNPIDEMQSVISGTSVAVLNESFSATPVSSPASVTTAVSDLTNIAVFRPDTFQAVAVDQLDVTERLDNIGVRKHNKQETIEFEASALQANLSSSFEILLDVPKTDFYNVVENRTFQRALSDIENVLNETDSAERNRIQLGGDAALGVSISFSAGALAWMLRGGSLLATMVAATPIWGNMDPLRVLNASKEKADADDLKVEELFE